MRPLLLSVLILLVTLPFANAQQADQRNNVSADQWILSQIGSYYTPRANSRLNEIKEKIKDAFKRKDLDGNGISQKDYDIEDQIQQASVRARTLSRWAKNDLDGNGLVTKEEYRIMFSKKVPRTLFYGGERVATTTEQRSNLIQKNVDKKMNDDVDEDEAISMQEAIAAAKYSRKSNYSFASRYKRMRRIPPSFDNNQDGVVTLPEFTIVTDRLLKRLDTDNSGILEQAEITYYHQLRKRASRALRGNYVPNFPRK